jgi:hypothetical protein
MLTHLPPTPTTPSCSIPPETANELQPSTELLAVDIAEAGRLLSGCEASSLGPGGHAALLRFLTEELLSGEQVSQGEGGTGAGRPQQPMAWCMKQ